VVNYSPKSSILAPVPRSHAQKLVHAVATYYPEFIRIYIPNNPYEKLRDGLESHEALLKKPEAVAKTSNETDEERSIRRTRKTIKDITLCNTFELFATFTFKEDRQNTTRSKQKMSNWLNNQRKRTGKFDYLIVSEFHKDQQSLHFHALLGGYQGKVAQSLNAEGNPKVVRGREAYHLPSYRLGFTDVKIIDNKKDSHTKVAFYIQKYITKDMPTFAGKKRYWTSKGLAKPVTEDNPPEWYLHIKPDREYINEHGKIIEFNAGKNPLVDMFMEARQ
jgi:hypothetical protein